MNGPGGLLTAARTDLAAADFVREHGEVFRTFDATTQDSGNVSYGVRTAEGRLFVKTAGSPGTGKPSLPHGERVALLRNAIHVARATAHPALPALRHVIESADGPLLVYEWADGDLMGVPRERRADPASSFMRFRALPLAERVAALDEVVGLHAELDTAGWVAVDFYDGSLLYDFAARRLRVVDLDHYRAGPSANEQGRMFGSSRFMAPEQFTLGATIDRRTTVFAVGCAVRGFIVEAGACPPGFATLVARACAPDPAQRFADMAEFSAAWRVLV